MTDFGIDTTSEEKLTAALKWHGLLQKEENMNKIKWHRKAGEGLYSIKDARFGCRYISDPPGYWIEKDNEGLPGWKLHTPNDGNITRRTKKECQDFAEEMANQNAGLCNYKVKEEPAISNEEFVAMRGVSKNA